MLFDTEHGELEGARFMLERETGIEPATNGLGSRDSTTELLPLVSRLSASVAEFSRRSPVRRCKLGRFWPSLQPLVASSARRIDCTSSARVTFRHVVVVERLAWPSKSLTWFGGAPGSLLPSQDNKSRAPGSGPSGQAPLRFTITREGEVVIADKDGVVHIMRTDGRATKRTIGNGIADGLLVERRVPLLKADR